MRVAVIGLHWGDEGKGKIIDLLARRSDAVIRYQGGANAGHTIVVEDEKFVFHLIPSGVLHPGKLNLIGYGVVFDPVTFLEEIDLLTQRGYDPNGRVKVDWRAHVVMPYHKRLDSVREKLRGNLKIGTTGRGIGPAYSDKYSRLGIRVIDLFNYDELLKKIEKSLAEKNVIFEKLYNEEPFDPVRLAKDYHELAKKLESYVVDGVALLNEWDRAGKILLFEGAQGTLLDIDLGTYPYVTSSHPPASGIPAGTGIAPGKIDVVIGVTKAYTTRVGAGPFPTELNDHIGEQIRKRGYEYGATTGRPRRCGWFDGVAGRYSVQVNGVTHIALTKLDVLDFLPEVKIAVAYRCDGKLLKDFPSDPSILEKCEPVYETFKGWQQDTSMISSFDELPVEAKDYIKAIEETVGAKVGILSIGAKRRATIFVVPEKELFSPARY